MKELLKLFVMLLMFTSFTACGSDDDDDAPSSGRSSIVGTWESSGRSLTFGRDGSYSATTYGTFTQYRKGTYSYNSSQSLLVINVSAVAGENGAYRETFIVQTLNSTTLVLLYTDGDVEGYYTRK